MNVKVVRNSRCFDSKDCAFSGIRLHVRIVTFRNDARRFTLRRFLYPLFMIRNVYGSVKIKRRMEMPAKVSWLTMMRRKITVNN